MDLEFIEFVKSWRNRLGEIIKNNYLNLSIDINQEIDNKNADILWSLSNNDIIFIYYSLELYIIVHDSFYICIINRHNNNKIVFNKFGKKINPKTIPTNICNIENKVIKY